MRDHDTNPSEIAARYDRNMSTARLQFGVDGDREALETGRATFREDLRVGFRDVVFGQDCNHVALAISDVVFDRAMTDAGSFAVGARIYVEYIELNTFSQEVVRASLLAVGQATDVATIS